MSRTKPQLLCKMTPKTIHLPFRGTTGKRLQSGTIATARRHQHRTMICDDGSPSETRKSSCHQRHRLYLVGMWSNPYAPYYESATYYESQGVHFTTLHGQLSLPAPKLPHREPGVCRILAGADQELLDTKSL